MKTGEMVVEVKVRTLPMKKAVIAQLPHRHNITLAEMKDFQPVCWFHGDAAKKDWRHLPVILGMFHGTPVLYFPMSVKRTNANGITWGLPGSVMQIPFAVVP